MPIEATEFRRVLSHWSSGVAVVATRTPDGRLWGLTATAFSSLSMTPPLVLACLERSAHTHDAIHASGCFTVNVLARGQDALARRFAGDDTPAKFDTLKHHVSVTGAPVLDDALAWVDCRLHNTCDGGDHTIFVGEVVAGDARDGEPLLYFRGRYSGLVG